MVDSGPRSVDRPVVVSPGAAVARAVVATGTEPRRVAPDRVEPVRPPVNGHWTAQGAAPSGARARPASAPVVPVGPVLPQPEAPAEAALICGRDGRIVQGNAA